MRIDPRLNDEELGVPAGQVSSDFQIAYYNIGDIVDVVPRMNIYIKCQSQNNRFKKTDHIANWQWFAKDES